MKFAPETGSNTNDETLEDEYEVEIVYPPEHDSGFCYDMTCPCHEDSDSMQALGEAVKEGEVTTQEADNIYHGKNV